MGALDLTLYSLPSLVAAALVPIIGISTLFIERGSRRGRGIAGFLFWFGVGAGFNFLMHATPADADPPETYAKLAYLFSAFAYLPFIHFLVDLAERSGAERPLGLPLRWGKWILRACVLLGVFDVWAGNLLAGVRWHAGTGWEHVWGPAWPVFTGGAVAFVAWGLACWGGECRRCQRITPDQWAWLAALLLLVGAPLVFGTFLPASGLAQTHAITPGFTVIGAIATLIGLILSRERELAHLRPVTPTSPAGGPSARAQRRSPGSARALACASCGAAFQSPDTERCPIDGGEIVHGPDPLVDRVIDGRYRVLGLLGAGGMARVYAAQHVKLGVRHALKVLWGDLAAQEAMTRRFLREARAASALQSPHIVRVHDVGELVPGLPYLVMDLVEGRPLGDLIDRHGPLRPPSVALLGAQLAEGLSAAHGAGVIHRDLKPDNVMLVRGADADHARIVDFGIARQVGAGAGDTRLTVTGQIFGTPLYMAPEQARGETAGPAADWYALGVLLYESASGRPPFPDGSPMQVMVKHLTAEPPRLPAGGPLADAVMPLLAKDPAAREAAAAGLSARLSALAGSERRIEPVAPGAPRPPSDPGVATTVVDPTPPG